MEIHQPGATRDEVDYSRLLFTNRDVTVYDHPFFHGCIDDYLPDALSHDLLATFPEETLHINYSTKATLDSDSARLKSFWLKSPFCKDLLDFFTSEIFLEDVRKFITPAVVRERGSGDPRGWYYVSNWSEASRSRDRTPIKVTFKFSRLNPGETGSLVSMSSVPTALISSGSQAA